jgi:hypothetical protein
VVREGTAVFELLARKDEGLTVEMRQLVILLVSLHEDLQREKRGTGHL